MQEMILERVLKMASIKLLHFSLMFSLMLISWYFAYILRGNLARYKISFLKRGKYFYIFLDS